MKYSVLKFSLVAGEVNDTHRIGSTDIEDPASMGSKQLLKQLKSEGFLGGPLDRGAVEVAYGVTDDPNFIVSNKKTGKLVMELVAWL